MCGLAGWFFPDTNKIPTELRYTIFSGLAYKSQFRGRQSFGIYFKNAKGKPERIRCLGEYTAWAENNHKKIREIIESPIVMIHTRLASKGDVSIRNCHPFQVGDYICAHNGCISNYDDLAKKLEHLIPGGETDSEAAFCWLIENGITRENYREIRGSFNFTIYNEKLNIFRLVSDSVIYYAELENGIIYQSESGPVDVVSKLLGLEEFYRLAKRELKISSTESELQDNIDSGPSYTASWPENTRGAGFLHGA